jgi:hypothetical protein
MRIAVLLGLVARQRHQPGFGLRRDDRFFARPWSILDGRQRPIAQRPLHAALNRLMVDPNSLPHRTERRILAIGQQHLRPRYPARGSVRDRERAVNLSISSSVIANSTARRHPAMMSLLVSPTAKQRIRYTIICSTTQVSRNRSSRPSDSSASSKAASTEFSKSEQNETAPRWRWIQDSCDSSKAKAGL